jgi:hypothetical protein
VINDDEQIMYMRDARCTASAAAEMGCGERHLEIAIEWSETSKRRSSGARHRRGELAIREEQYKERMQINTNNA